MYYYIFDPPSGAKDYERTAQIKELLSSLGIAGEMTSPHPGKSVEDLVHLAVAKRYSTIVAVGGMELVNQVARAIEPYDVVFGIIPSGDHPDLQELIGAADWKAAAEQLKRRRWQSLRLGLLNGSIGFLTPAVIPVNNRVQFQLVTPDFALRDQGGTITITPVRDPEDRQGNLLVEITPQTQEKAGFLGGLFGKRSEAPRESRFMVNMCSIHTESPTSVLVAGTALATTPVECTTQTKSVKLIVGKSITS